MLLDESDYDYIDWTIPQLSDTEIDGMIMPMEDFMQKPHALRGEDFCYVWEAINQLRYAGRLTAYVNLSVYPSVEKYKLLRDRMCGLSGYFLDHGSGTNNFMFIKPTFTMPQTGWFNSGRDTAAALKQYIPQSQLVDFSDIYIEPDEDIIEDELMVAMYNKLEKLTLYNSPISYSRDADTEYGLPGLGLWQFTATMHQTYYNEDGTINQSRSGTYPISNNRFGEANSSFGSQIHQNHYPAASFDLVRAYSQYSSGYKLYEKMYYSGASLTIRVPQGTTECWMYLTISQYATNDVPLTGRIMKATVNTSNNTATISGFGTDDDITTFINLGNKLQSYAGGYWRMFLTAVFCKVDDAKWHWW